MTVSLLIAIVTDRVSEESSASPNARASARVPSSRFSD